MGFLRPLVTATRFMVGMVACMMAGAPILADITPTGSVVSDETGPILPTSGDLILNDTDFIRIDDSSLLVIDGGSLLRTGGVIGAETDGSLTVTGPGTRLELNDVVSSRLGFSSGTVSILNGAVVDASANSAGCNIATCGIGIGVTGGADGLLLVSGAGSQLLSTEAFAVGAALVGLTDADGIGRLIVEQGGAVDASRIGFSQGTANSTTAISRAFITIRDPTSRVTGSLSAIIANAENAEAEVSVENQGLFTTPILVFGAGINSTGTLDVITGGTVTADLVRMSIDIGSTSAWTLDGVGTTGNISDDVLVGQVGTASLNVLNNAALNVGGGAPGALLGSGVTVGTTGGIGSVLVDNATITMTPNTDLMDVRFSIGLFGTGDVVMQNGATILLEDLSGQPGLFGDGVTVGQSQPGTPGDGSLDIQGAGTTLTVDSADVGFLIVGLDQAGTDAAVGVVDVGDGATVNITGIGSAAASGIALGRGGNADGTMNVTGVGTTVNVLGAPGAILVAGDLGNAIGDGTALFTVSDNAVVNINSTTAGQSSLNVGLGTGTGVVQVTNAVINIDGTLNISLPTATNSTQSGSVQIDGLGIINAIDVVVGNRGVLNSIGTLNANTLSLSTGATVDLLDLSTIASTTTLTGGTLNLADAIVLSSAQSLTATDGGIINIDNPSLTVGGTLTLSDPGTLFDMQALGTHIVDVTGGVFLNDQASFQMLGDFNVMNGGVLGGNGGTLTTGIVNVTAGGTIAPGNSPGTLNIVGDVSLDGGTIFLEIGGALPGEFDVLNIDGALNLNSGAFAVELINGFTPGGRTFDVLTATGGISLDPGVSFLSVGAGPDFELTFNQAGTIGTVSFLSREIATIGSLNRAQQPFAFYIDDVCARIESLVAPNATELDLDTVCGNLRNGSTTDAQVATAINAISPDDIIGAIDSLFRFTTIHHGNIARRLNGLRNGAERVNLRGVNIETDDVSISGEDLQKAIEALANENFDRWGFFSDGRINFGDRDESIRVRGFDFDTVSLTFGTDYRLRHNMYLGVALGYNEVDADFDAGGGLTQKSTTLSLLGTYFNSSYYLDMLLTYGISDLDTSRDVIYTDAGGTISRKADGSTNGDQLVGGIGTGFDFGKRRWVFGPHAGANFSEITVDSFDETGAGGLNFALPEQVTRSMTANVGVHVSYTMTPNWGVLVPYFRADYIHEFKNKSDRAKVRLVNDRFGADPVAPTSPVAVETDGSDPNYVVWSIGAHAQFIRGLAAFIDYRGTIGLNELDVSEISVGMRYEHRF